MNIILIMFEVLGSFVVGTLIKEIPVNPVHNHRKCKVMIETLIKEIPVNPVPNHRKRKAMIETIQFWDIALSSQRWSFQGPFGPIE